LSGDVIKQLHRIDVDLALRFNDVAEKHPLSTIRFVAPNDVPLDIDFLNPSDPESAAYVSKRIDFDNFLFEEVQNLTTVKIFQNYKVLDVQTNSESAIVTTDKGVFHGKVVLGADGAQSIVNKKLTSTKIDRKHYMAGVQQYYEGVDNYQTSATIELHFQKELLPGYFWIFPLPNNQWNVGLGIPSDEVSINKINLKQKLNSILEHHPVIKERFKNAKPLEDVQGFGLPLGSRKVTCSGTRLLLLGDAASLIDPFSGEGIANAIRSGRIAADHLTRVFQEQRFDADFNKSYHKEIYARMGNEFRVSAAMKKLLRFPFLFNLLINKAAKNKSLQTFLTAMIYDLDLRKELQKPKFYFKLLFNR